jgi:hypothetical protein
MINVLQRPAWHGSPVDLGDVFVLKKRDREAKASLRTHQFGWELRLFIGSQLETVQSQVCRSQEDVLSTAESWKTAMQAKGWS